MWEYLNVLQLCYIWTGGIRLQWPGGSLAVLTTLSVKQRLEPMTIPYHQSYTAKVNNLNLIKNKVLIICLEEAEKYWTLCNYKPWELCTCICSLHCSETREARVADFDTIIHHDIGLRQLTEPVQLKDFTNREREPAT